MIESIISAICPYIPQIVSVALSILLSWITARFTARNETMKSLREKRVETYDEVIAFLDKFRTNPVVALDDSFYSSSLKISNHLRAYGSDSVIAALKEMTEDLHREKRKYDTELKNMYGKYMPEEEIVDDGVVVGQQPRLMADMDVIDSFDEAIVKKHTLTCAEALKIVEPVLQAIRQSLSD